MTLSYRNLFRAVRAIHTFAEKPVGRFDYRTGYATGLWSVVIVMVVGRGRGRGGQRVDQSKRSIHVKVASQHALLNRVWDLG
jgi:hypothetical protein